MKQVKKTTIVEYLYDHAYWRSFEFWPIAWNIKMYKHWQWTPGQSPQYGIENDPGYDERWEEWLEENDWFFESCCQEALSGFMGEWDFLEGHPDEDLNVPYKFYTAGRCGGWLVLDKWAWCKFYYQEKWEEWEYPDLWKLYKFCKEVEKMVNGRFDEFEYLYATKRKELEVEWAEEDKEAKTLEEENTPQISHITA